MLAEEHLVGRRRERGRTVKALRRHGGQERKGSPRAGAGDEQVARVHVRLLTQALGSRQDVVHFIVEERKRARLSVLPAVLTRET